MKTFKLRYLTLVLVFFNLSLYAQIQNPGFETWTGGSPDNWMTLNVPNLVTLVTQSSDAHSGSSAAKGTVVGFSGTVLSPALTSGVGGLGFPFTNRPKTFSFWYKFNSVGSDILATFCYLKKGDNIIGTATGAFDAAGSYTKASLDLAYSTEDIPDKCVIQFVIADKNSQSTIDAGSYYIVDDVALEGTSTDVKTDNTIPSKFELKQNYPNPFNPSTLIEYSVPEKSFVKIGVYNLIGQKVADLINETKDAGNYQVQFNAQNITAGVYFYKLEAGSFASTRKMILTK